VTATMLALLLIAVTTGYAAAMVLRSKLSPAATILTLACYLLAGLQLALLFTLSGGGVLLPGRQINPAIVAEWQGILAGTPLISPWLVLVTLLAHLAILIIRPGRAGLLWPLPATIACLALMVVVQQRMDRGPSRIVPGIGPERIAYLTIEPTSSDGAVRLMFAEGAASDPLFEIRYVHDVAGAPPKPQLVWTKDGQVIVFRSRTRGLLALGPDGALIGKLPLIAEDWPQTDPNVERISAREEFSRARMEVDQFVREHGGFFVPAE